MDLAANHLLMRLIALALFCASTNSMAQSAIGIGISANYLQVSYINSQGVKSDKLSGLPGAGAFFLFDKVVANKSSRLEKHIVGNVGYRTSAFKDNDANLLTKWSVNFLETSVALKLVQQSKRTVAPMFMGGLSHHYLIAGTQSRGFEQYDLTNNLRRQSFNVLGAFGLSYRISQENSCALILSYTRGLSNMERDQNQNAKFHVWQLSTSVMLGITKKK
jgi:hypothetical protein